MLVSHYRETGPSEQVICASRRIGASHPITIAEKEPAPPLCARTTSRKSWRIMSSWSSHTRVNTVEPHMGSHGMSQPRADFHEGGWVTTLTSSRRP